MATKTQSQGGKTGSGRTGSGADERSAFSFGGNGAGVLAGAALAGAAVGIAANVGRKLFVQMSSGATGDWVDAHKAEHRLALGIFDKILATTDSQTMTRTHLFGKLKHALEKHAVEEENVIYPALRQANLAHDADTLNSEHGYVKTYLYELETLSKDSPEWLARLRDFRSMIEEHMKMEENQVFPAFQRSLSDKQNAKLAAMMNKEGVRHA